MKTRQDILNRKKELESRKMFYYDKLDDCITAKDWEGFANVNRAIDDVRKELQIINEFALVIILA